MVFLFSLSFTLASNWECAENSDKYSVQSDFTIVKCKSKLYEGKNLWQLSETRRIGPMYCGIILALRFAHFDVKMAQYVVVQVVVVVVTSIHYI